MTDLNDPSGAALRLSHEERDRAVAALQAHGAQGRLTDTEVETRVQSARTAVTRGDLAPLFADLPGQVDLEGTGGAQGGSGTGASGTGTPSTGAPAAGAAYATPSYQAPPQPFAPRDPSGGSSHFGRWGLAIVSVTPFVALILFFVTSAIWGYALSWLWFLLVPIVGALVYGVDGGQGRDPDRDRR